MVENVTWIKNRVTIRVRVSVKVKEKIVCVWSFVGILLLAVVKMVNM